MTVMPSRRALLQLQWLRPAPRVDAGGCLARTGCGVCVERCPIPGAMTFGAALAAAGPVPVIDAAACDRCGRCVEVCPAPSRCIVLG